MSTCVFFGARVCSCVYSWTSSGSTQQLSWDGKQVVRYQQLQPAEVRAESSFGPSPSSADVTALSTTAARSSSTQRSPWLLVESGPGLRRLGSRPGGNHPEAAACSDQDGPGEGQRHRQPSQNRRATPDRYPVVFRLQQISLSCKTVKQIPVIR